MKYAVLVVLLLAGCVSEAERTAADHDKCINMGFKKGTDGYANCRLTLSEVRRERRKRKAADVDNMIRREVLRQEMQR